MTETGLSGQKAEGYDLTAVHRANLKILKEIDRICRKYGISYVLDAGLSSVPCGIRVSFRGMTMPMWLLQEKIMRNFPEWPGRSCPEG